MMLESSRTLGAIGTLLMVIGPLASIYTGAIGLIGVILVLIAFNGLADHYKERHIFTNALYGFIAAIIGAVIAVAVIVTAALGMLSALGISDWTNWTALQNVMQNFTNWDALAPYIGAMVGALIVLFVFVFIAAVFVRRSLDTLSEKSGVHMFATAGLLMLIGAILTVIVIGLVLIWVALILLIVAFFEIRTAPAQVTTAPQPTS